ncbi:UNVERIFIED_CONTAM: hypothetical protein K2H54_034382 [Gekko kuhli]
MGISCQLATSECQQKLSLAEEGKPNELAPHREAISEAREAIDPVVQEYTAERQTCIYEDGGDVAVSPVRGNAELSASDITVEEDAVDDSIYFTPELYDESAEEEIVFNEGKRGALRHRIVRSPSLQTAAN